MSDRQIDNGAIRQFVRESLGCTCPEQVFNRIRVTAQSAAFFRPHTLLEIGGRLCVAVVAPADWHDIEPDLGTLVDTGMGYRDRYGFNRLRLVVVADDDQAKRHLPGLFNSLPGIDDRVHLHVIDPELVPSHVIDQAD